MPLWYEDSSEALRHKEEKSVARIGILAGSMAHLLCVGIARPCPCSGIAQLQHTWRRFTCDRIAQDTKLCLGQFNNLRPESFVPNRNGVRVLQWEAIPIPVLRLAFVSRL